MIVVLGMHRSGTSAVTRALGALGAELGPNLTPAGADNPRGFFEDADIHALNLALLRTLGHDWDTVTPVLPEDLARPGLEPFRRHARALLARRLGPRPFAFKDPRVCRLLPFWKQVFARMDLEPQYVLVSRHPQAVAGSLARRDGFLAEKSYLLWLGHMFAALRHTTGAARAAVSFEALLDAPADEMTRLAEALGLEASAGAVRVIEPELCHARREPEVEMLPASVAAVHALLEAAAGGRCDLEGAVAKSQLRATGAWMANAYHALRALDAGAPARAYAAVCALEASQDACAALGSRRRVPQAVRAAAHACRLHVRAVRARRQLALQGARQ